MKLSKFIEIFNISSFKVVPNYAIYSVIVGTDEYDLNTDTSNTPSGLDLITTTDFTIDGSGILSVSGITVDIDDLEIENFEETVQNSNLTTEQSDKLWRMNTSLTRRRFKIGESLYEISGSTVASMIGNLLPTLPEPDQTVATIAYNETGRFDRLDPFITDFSQALGMTDEQTDEFFRYCLEERWNDTVEEPTSGSV